MPSSQDHETFVQVKPKLEYKKDIVCFPIIDWNFRYQRTQHLLSKFAENGHRVFHLKVKLLPEKRAYTITNIIDNIFEINLSCSSRFNVYRDIFKKQTLGSAFSSLEQMQRDLHIDGLSFVAFPAWAPVVLALKRKHGWPIIYDCLDDYYVFGNVDRERVEEELKLFNVSDLVITTSAYLYKKAKKVTNKTLCIPNAGEFDRFNILPPNDLLKDIKKPMVGYYGAIAEWFDHETVEFIAIKRPNINFIFIGYTYGSNIAKLVKLPNVHFLGEKPYSSLPSYLYHFDACLIPFKFTHPGKLIEAIHPVKVYEYLASGKPVVSTNISELIPFGYLCYLSSSKEEFLMNLDKALGEDRPDLVKRRIEFASKNTWQDRFDFLYSEVKKLSPL